MIRLVSAMVVLTLTGGPFAGVVATTPTPDETEIAYRAAQEGLSRSPDMFLAGVLRCDAEPRCEGEGNRRRCVYDAKVVRVLASKIVGEGETLRVSGNVEPGREILGFFIPSGPGDTWSATFLSFDTGPAKWAQMEKAMKMAGVLEP